MKGPFSVFRFPFSVTSWGLFIALLPAPLVAGAADLRREQRGDIVATAEIDRTAIALSGSLQLTLTVEGPARVEVKPPKPLLQKASAQSWLVKENGLPTVENLDNGRQRWRQEFRLEPYDVGPKVEIALATLQVKAGNQLEMTISWEKGPFIIQVTTSIARADSQALRPPTDIEPLPEKVEGPGSSGITWILAGSILAGLLALLLTLRIRRRRARDQSRRFGVDWALAELDRIGSGPARFDLLAETLRLYVQQQLGVPATRLTTNELTAALPVQVAQPLGEELATILQQCDVAKFANAFAAGESNEWSEAIAKAKVFVEDLSKTGIGNGE